MTAWFDEPIPAEVRDAAAAAALDPAALDHHVEGVHGWEPHDIGYAAAVAAAARCLALGGCEGTP